MKRTSWSQGLSVTGDGPGVVPLAGAVTLRLLADRVGLTAGCPRRCAAAASCQFMTGAGCGWMWR